MFGSAIRLPFTLLGIPVKIDTSFLLVLPLFAWLIGSQVPVYGELLQRQGVVIDVEALQRGATPYLLGLGAAVGLGISVLIHELGHAVAARWYGVEVKQITLWLLGGMAQFEALPRQRGGEAVVAVVGPITSLALAGVLYGAWQWGSWNSAALFVLAYLTLMNALLALFNLLPALPLDGGRVLRSLLALSMPHLRATRVAAGVSRLVAVLLGIYGVLTFQLFITLVAFFIYGAVRAETQYALVSQVFEGVLVGDIMTPENALVTVEPHTPVEQLVRLSSFRRHTGYPVVAADGRLLGMAKLQDALREDEAGRTRERVVDIMQPAETIAPEVEVMTALKRFNDSELGRLAVVDGPGRLVGLLARSDVVRELQRRHDTEREGDADGEERDAGNRPRGEGWR